MRIRSCLFALQWYMNEHLISVWRWRWMDNHHWKLDHCHVSDWHHYNSIQILQWYHNSYRQGTIRLFSRILSSSYQVVESIPIHLHFPLKNDDSTVRNSIYYKKERKIFICFLRNSVYISLHLNRIYKIFRIFAKQKKTPKLITTL